MYERPETTHIESDTDFVCRKLPVAEFSVGLLYRYLELGLKHFREYGSFFFWGGGFI